MADLISRQAVIDEIKERISANKFSGNVGLISELNRLEGYVLQLPPAQPEITEEDIELYCRKRCLVVITDELFAEMKTRWSAQPEPEKYEYHYDHTDCIWYRPEARNRCPTTCAQYRDGWNDAMNYIFRDGKGYRPYRRDKQYEE